MGYASTLEYVKAAAAAVLHQTGLLPHINAGLFCLFCDPEVVDLLFMLASNTPPTLQLIKFAETTVLTCGTYWPYFAAELLGELEALPHALLKYG